MSYVMNALKCVIILLPLREQVLEIEIKILN